MTVLHSGSTKKFAVGWEGIFAPLFEGRRQRTSESRGPHEKAGNRA